MHLVFRNYNMTSHIVSTKLLFYFRAWVTFLLFTSRSFVVAAFQTVYVYTCEIYPTTIRALGLGSGSGISRLGSMVTPFVAQVLLHSSIRAAMGVYFLVGSVAAVAALFLPLETKGRQMRVGTSLPKFIYRNQKKVK